jgi:hypothetical protein
MSDQPGSNIKAGDRVTRRGSAAREEGSVIEVHRHGAGFVVPDRHLPPPGPDDVAWVLWDGATVPVTERLADLDKVADTP